MGIFSWREEYGVGCERIDRQHRELFGIADRLHEAMSAGEGREALGPVLGQLIGYAATHFATEEALMEAHGYPGAAAHREEHARLTRRVLWFQREFAAGRVALTVNILHFLKDWLAHHIATSDRRIGTWLAARAAA